MAIYDEAKRADIAGRWEVARDPHCDRYGDEGWAAIDETNWDAFLSDLGGEDGDDQCPMAYIRGRWGSTWELESDACRKGTCEHGYAILDRCLLVREGSDAWDVWEDVQRALANYPILDEDAYSQREMQAWDEYVGNGWAHDLARHAESGPFVDGRWTYGPELRERIADGLIGAGCEPWADDENGTGWEDADELVWVVETWIKENVDAWSGPAMDAMSYWYGFTGESDDDSAAAVVETMVIGAWEAMRLLAVAGHDWVVAANGQARLPLVWDGAR